MNERDGERDGRAGSPRREGGVGWPAGHWVGVGEWVDDREREERKGAFESSACDGERREEDRSLAIPTRGRRGEKCASLEGDRIGGSLSRCDSPPEKATGKRTAALDEGMIAVVRGNVRR